MILYLFLDIDCVDTYINSDMSADAVDYEAESWSLTVEHKFCKKQDKRAVKRQDVIYGKQMSELRKKTTGICHLCHQCQYFIYKMTVTTCNCFIIVKLLRLSTRLSFVA